MREAEVTESRQRNSARAMDGFADRRASSFDGNHDQARRGVDEKGNGRAASSGTWAKPPQRRKSDLIVGHSLPTRQLLVALDSLAPSALPVLVSGENGVVKERAARVVAAPRRNLDGEVRAGRFSSDLFSMLVVNALDIAPLRARLGDIISIAKHYLSMIAGREGECIPRLTDGALDRLLSYPWPGNVRELIACLEQATLLSPGRP